MQRKRISLVVITIMMLSLLAVALQPLTVYAGETLAIEVASGGNSVKLTKADLLKMKIAEGNAGLIRSTGTLKGPYDYKAVTVSDLLAKVGGLGAGQGIQITASDGYTMTFSNSQVNGNVLTYDEAGKVLRIGDVSMALIFESEILGEDTLPRLAYIKEGANPITDGHWWVKSVAKIEVVDDVEDWVIALEGLEKAEFDRATFESIATCPDTPHPTIEWETTDKQGNKEVYEGVALWVMVSMMDGGDSPQGHYRFNDDLARKGYKVEVVSVDGYSVELESMLIMRNKNIILAYKKNGEFLKESDGPLMLAGDDLPSRKFMVKQIAKIRLVDLP